MSGVGDETAGEKPPTGIDLPNLRYSVPMEHPERDKLLAESLTEVQYAAVIAEDEAAEERALVEEKYEGPLDRQEVALLGKEDAVEISGEARRRSASRSSSARMLVYSGSWDPMYPGRLEERIEQARHDGWDKELWNVYARSFNAQLAAMDIELLVYEMFEGDGWSSAYVVDLRKWEKRPKADGHTDPDKAWRRRSRRERFLNAI